MRDGWGNIGEFYKKTANGVACCVASVSTVLKIRTSAGCIPLALAKPPLYVASPVLVLSAVSALVLLLWLRMTLQP